MARILVVDDERSMREFLEILLRKGGHEVKTASDVPAGLAVIQSDEELDLVITDLRIGTRSGLEILKACKAAQPQVEVMIITAYATTENAVQAMKLGAYDYVTKPFKNDEFSVLVDKALEKRRLARENESLRIQLGTRARVEGMEGSGPGMREVFALVDKVAASRTTVLVIGESGVGKELVARAVHHRGPRASAPFVPINCGAIPEGLVESELFGHVRGAFTGAHADHPGLFKAASGGTVFLDEVGELPLPAQVKLLRAIQEKRIRAVGGQRDFEIDVRLIAATNRDLEEEVREGRFREDLYYRLNVIQIRVPPLRDRREDVLPLAQHFVERFSAETGRGPLVLTPEAASHLLAYDWPGNVRELENAMERAVTLSDGGAIAADVLPASIRGLSPAMPQGELVLAPGGLDLQGVLDSLERRYLQLALQKAGGVKTEAAKLLGLTFRSMRYRLAKQGLAKPERSEAEGAEAPGGADPREPGAGGAQR